MDPADEGVPYGTRLTELASERPDYTAVITVAPHGGERALTLAQLESGANQWGRELAAAGATVSSYVALVIPNSIELVLAAFGCWKIGAVPIPVRWDMPEWERSRLVEAIAPAVVIDEAVCPAFAAAAALQPDSALPEAVTPMVNGICSSGSTGMPKVILDTQPALWTELKTQPFMAIWAPVPRPQVILVPAPMYHTNGFNTLFYILGGDRLVILEKFDAELFLDVVERHRVTNFTATPTMLARIARVPDVDRRDLSSVVWILQGAAVMPAALLEKWFALLSPEQVLMAYGMTENFGLTVLRGDEWLEHRGSTGRGFRETEIKILDANGNEVPTGEMGEIYMRVAGARTVSLRRWCDTTSVHSRRFSHRRRHRLGRRGRLSVCDRPARRHDRHRRRQRVPRGGGGRTGGAQRYRRCRGVGPEGSGVGPSRTCGHPVGRPRQAAVRTAGDRLRKGQARLVQGTQNRRIRR